MSSLLNCRVPSFFRNIINLFYDLYFYFYIMAPASCCKLLPAAARLSQLPRPAVAGCYHLVAAACSSYELLPAACSSYELLPAVPSCPANCSKLPCQLFQAALPAVPNCCHTLRRGCTGILTGSWPLSPPR